MSLEVRRVALASPFATGPTRFVVGGQAGTNASGNVKMFEWDRARGDLRMTGVQTDVGQIRAMACSPHPTYAHLVACGLSSGRIHLVSLSPSTLTASLSSGETNTSPSPTAPSATVLSPKHARAITALSFSPVDPNYLAAGLERHRSDSSVLIWDVHDALASLPPESRAGGDARWARPGQRLDITAGGSGPSGRHVQQYCPAEHVHSVAFMPSSYTVLASSNNKVVRLFDLRSPTPSGAAAGASSALGAGVGGTASPSPRDPSSSTSGAVQSWLTRAVHNLTPDPASACRFASWEPLGGGRGSVVRIWDTRRQADVVHFEAGDGVLGLHWTTDGLAVGTKDGGVGIWEVLHGTKASESGRDEEWTTLGTMRQVIKPRPNLHSFAYAPAERGADVLVVGKDGALGIGPVTTAPAIGHSSRDDITIASYEVQAVHSEDVPPAPEAVQPAPGRGRSPFQLSGSDAERILASRGLDQLSDQLAQSGVQVTPDQALSSSIHRRAVFGYSPKDLLFNAAIAAKSGENSALAGVWEIADRITRVMDLSHSRSKNYDLIHAGVYTIWTSAGLSSNGGAIPAPASLRSAAGSGSAHTKAGGPGGGAIAGADGGSEREPIRQGSAAWASLKQSQQHHGGSRHATHQPHLTQPSSAASGSALSGGGPSSGPSRQHHPYRRHAQAAASGPPPVPDADFLAALESINSSRDMVHPGAVGPQKLPSGDRPAARRMILALCGRGRVSVGSYDDDEGLGEDDQEEADDSNVGGHKRSRAACWAWFEGEQERAIRTLLDSSNSQHRLLASLVAAAAARQASSGRKGAQQQNASVGQPDWADIISGLDDPYVRAVLKRATGHQSSPIALCSDEAMHLVDRIGLACLLMSDRELTDFLHGLWRRSLDSPSVDLDYLFLTGLSPLALPLLQTYVDSTSDIQTAAILSALIPPFGHGRPYASASDGGGGGGADAELIERWAEMYRDMLDSWNLFSARVAYDVSRGSWAERLGAKRGGGPAGQCPVCTHTLSHQEEELVKRKHAIRGAVSWPNERTNTCAYCSNPLPRCIICLQLVQSPHTRGYSAAGQPHDDELLDSPHGMDTLDSMYVACQTCRHGGHANHVLAWFEGGLDADVPGHDICAVKGCGCRCASI